MVSRSDCFSRTADVVDAWWSSSMPLVEDDDLPIEESLGHFTNNVKTMMMMEDLRLFPNLMVPNDNVPLLEDLVDESTPPDVQCDIDVYDEELVEQNGRNGNRVHDEESTTSGEEEGYRGKSESKRRRNGAGRRAASSLSPTDVEATGGLSKNAIAARENRIRKKKYIQSLEETVRILRHENRGLKSRVSSLEGDVDRLESEVGYLHGVLSNVDEISALLRSVRSTSGLKVQTNCGRGARTALMTPTTKEDKSSLSAHQIRKRHRSSGGSSDEVKVEIGQSTPNTNSGICFHVNKGKVSLEFCPNCSSSAQQATQNSG